MRYCRKDIFLVKPGERLPEEKRKTEPKKRKAPRKLTADEQRKVNELRKKVSEQASGERLPRNVEIR